jgi:CHAT domain-containing protein
MLADFKIYKFTLLKKYSKCVLIFFIYFTLFVYFPSCKQHSESGKKQAGNIVYYKDSAHYNYFHSWFSKTKDTADLIQFQENYLDSIKKITDDTSWLKANLESYNFIYNASLALSIDKAHVFLKKIVEYRQENFSLLKFNANYFIGSDLYDNGDIINCIPFLETALLISSKVGFNHPDDKDYLLNTLGNSYTRLGDYKKSSEYLLKAYDYNIERKEPNFAAKQINNLSRVLFDLNLSDSAIKLLKPVITLNEVSRKRRITALCELSRHYSNKSNPDSSVKYLTEAETDSKLLRGDDSLIAEQKIKEAQLLLYAKGNNPQELISRFETDIINSERGDDRDYCKQINILANAFVKVGKFDSAFFYYNSALGILTKTENYTVFSIPSSSKLYAENTILESLDAKAGALELLYRQNHNIKYLTTAIQCYTLSFEVEKKLMQYFSYDESKLLMLNESRQRSQKAINLCYRLYQLTKDNQWAQKAFEFAEKNKAFVLLESVKRNLASNSALQNDTLYQNTQKLQLQLAYTERSLAEASGDSAKLKLEQQKTKLENELLFANTALGRQSIAYKTVMEKEDNISAAAVSADLLNENTGLIEFFNADSVTYAFVLNKKQPIQFIRYDSNLSTAIDSMLYFFKSASAIGNQPLAYQKAAYNLYKTLQFDQLGKGWQNLIIIPDGKISFLPFDALITNTSFTVNLQQANYFINQCNTLYGYSAAILLKQLHNNQSPGKSTTIFAPVFANSENQQQPLLYSLQEAEAIGTNKNTTSFVKEKATLGNFKQQFANTGILHIATHAYADTGANSNPKIEFIDSSLLLNELYAMHTNASLVVLSACETGLGRLNSSEGPMSLARGFYYAGAQNVITSYWNVDDKSTAALFSSVYKNMESSSSSNAIYLAKKELIKNENGKFASPYYWAGFVHIGMPQKKESRNYWWWLLILPVLVIIFYWQKNKMT